MNILIINGSVRQAQATRNATNWVQKTANSVLGGANVSVIDLKELAMPMFDEATLPMMNKDRQPEGSVKTWLEALDDADGYVFVTPEYNHGVPAGLKSAIDYINFQIMHKPFLVVSHGANGGARSAEQLKGILNANIGGLPVPSGVTINGMVGFQNLISEDGEILDEATKSNQATLESKLQELSSLAEALQAARAQ
jgi:NAD(P)H-dependent FMN reductase